MNDGLIGGDVCAALFVVAADQKHRVVGARPEQDHGHERHGELRDGHATLAEGRQHPTADGQADPDHQ